MGQIKKLYQNSGDVVTTESTESNAVYPLTASSAVYHQSNWGTGGSGQTVSGILTALNQGFQYMGVATPSTTPVAATHKIFYLASEDGTYYGFGGITVSGLTVLSNGGSGWSKEELNISGGGGGTPSPSGGGYIGTTAVQSSRLPQGLTGISSISLEDSARIYFDSARTAYIECTPNGFHFSKAVYSDEQVSAGGIGSDSGGGEGGGGSYSGGNGIDIVGSTISVKLGTGLGFDEFGNIYATGGGSSGEDTWGIPDYINHIVPVTVNGETLNVCLDGYGAGGGSTTITITDTQDRGTTLANISVNGGSPITIRDGLIWGTYNSTNKTVKLSINGVERTLCLDGYSSGSGGSTVTWGSAGSDYIPLVVNGTSKNLLTAHQTIATLTFGNKTYNGSSARTITAADLGALTSHQSISTLTLSPGKFTSGTTSWTPTGSSKSVNIPTTLDHITDGSERSLGNFVTLNTTQEINAEKTFRRTLHFGDDGAALGLIVHKNSYIDIGGARLVYDENAKALHVKMAYGNDAVGFFADGQVSSGGAAAQSTVSFVSVAGLQTVTGEKTFTANTHFSGTVNVGTITFEGSENTQSITDTTNKMYLQRTGSTGLSLCGAGGQVVIGALTSTSQSKLYVKGNGTFSGIVDTGYSQGHDVSIQDIVNRLVQLETA